MAVQKSRKLPSIYLLLAEFSVRTVNYGSSFFFHRSVIYSTDRKNEANKMFITWLLQVSGTGNKCRTRDLTIINFDRRQERKFLLADENNTT